ncbi:MAG: OmpH family outer membrane protein [Planctomycetota bacterium]
MKELLSNAVLSLAALLSVAQGSSVAQDSSAQKSGRHEAKRPEKKKQGGQRIGGPKIAVVDINLVLKRSKKLRQTYFAPFEKKRLEQLERMDRIQKKLQQLKTDLILLTKGSKEYDEKRLEILLLDKKMRLTDELASKWFTKEDRRMKLAIYDKIEEKVALLAQQRGIDLVFKKSSEETRNRIKDERERLSSRLAASLLYASKGLDISEDVIRLLDNADVKNATRAKPTKPANRDGK